MKKLLGFATLLILLSNCQKTGNEPFYEEGTKEINGTNLYYKIIGEGEPLLIIHGGPGLSHDYFMPHLAPLSEKFQLIFYDQRASGGSSKELDPSSISLENFLKDIDGIRESLGLAKINILAHSWGGLLGMKYATAYPQRCDALVLVNSVGASSEVRALNNQKVAERFTKQDSVDRAQLLNSEGFRNLEPQTIEQLMKIGFRQQFHNPALLDSLNLSIRTDFGETNELLQNLAQDLTEYDFHEELTKISIPTLLIYGDYDPLTEIAGARLKQSIPNAERQLLNNCGHFPFIEKPEAFVRTVTDFLKRSK